MKFNRFSKISITILITILLTSCIQKTPRQNIQSQLAIPDQWQSQAQPDLIQNQALAVDWLNDFADPALKQLVNEALTHNYDLSAAAINLEITHTAVLSSRAGLFPTVNLSSNRSALSGDIQQRIGDDIISAPLDQVDYSGSLNVSWEVDIWGRQYDEFKASHQDLKTNEQDYKAARLSLTGSVVQSWYGLIATRLQRELAEKNVASSKKIHALTQKRYQHKLVTKLDLAQARSRLYQAQNELYQRQQTEHESTRALEILLGRYPSAEIKTASNLPKLSSLYSDDQQNLSLGSPTDVLSQRPDILSAEAAMTAAGLRAREARKTLLPTLNISEFFSLSNEASISSLLSLENVLQTLSISLIQPIFQGGALRASIKAEKKRAEVAVANYAQVVLEAFVEIENAIDAEHYLEQQENIQRLAVDEAIESQSLIGQQYSKGITDIFNVLDVEQQRFNSEEQLISAQLARLDNRVRLYLSLGGMYASNEER